MVEQEPKLMRLASHLNQAGVMLGDEVRQLLGMGIGRDDEGAKSASETAIRHGATPIPMCGVSILKAETAIHTRTAVAVGDYLVGLI